MAAIALRIPLGDKWLHTGTLGDLLNSIKDPSPVLDVLRPVVAKPEEVLLSPNLGQKSKPTNQHLCWLKTSSATNICAIRSL